MNFLNFCKVMIKSIPENFIILLFGLFAGLLLRYSKKNANTVAKCFEEDGGKKLKDNVYYQLDKAYTTFITIISIFPLLGMFGTVMALINLDMTKEMEALKVNFFSALTSTAWGIIFAIIFKLWNAKWQPYIENQIKKAKEILNI